LRGLGLAGLVAATAFLAASCVGPGMRERRETAAQAEMRETEELLRELEEFQKTLEQSKEAGKETASPGISAESPTELLEIKAAGPGTGIEAEKLPPMAAESWPRVPSPPREPSEVATAATPQPSARKLTPEDIAEEFESASLKKPHLRHALAALYLAVGDPQKAFLTAAHRREDEEDWEKLIQAAASFRIGETDAALSLAREVLHDWQEQAPLQVTRLALCRRISSYGVFDEYDRDWVAAGQEMLLYCEVVNFVSERQEDGSYLIDMPLTLEIYEGWGNCTGSPATRRFLLMWIWIWWRC